LTNRTDIRFPIFGGYKVRVILARNVERTGQRLHVDLSPPCKAASVTNGTKTGWIVLGPEFDEGMIAHEASHAVRAMLAFMGARNDDETFAYHLDFLVGRIHKFLKGRA
jgi:hypothetical protein